MNTVMTLIAASDTKISDAALYALIGFIIVLAVLALLVGIFYLTGYLFSGKAFDRIGVSRKKTPETENINNADGDEAQDEQTVAVITAAIAAVLASENGGEKPDFVIRRIKRDK